MLMIKNVLFVISLTDPKEKHLYFVLKVATEHMQIKKELAQFISKQPCDIKCDKPLTDIEKSWEKDLEQRGVLRGYSKKQIQILKNSKEDWENFPFELDQSGFLIFKIGQDISGEQYKIADLEDIKEYVRQLLSEATASMIRLNDIQKLITEEILICHKEGTPTSRLTSLSVKIYNKYGYSNYFAKQEREKARQEGYEVGYSQANTDSGMPKPMIDFIKEQEREKVLEEIKKEILNLEKMEDEKDPGCAAAKIEILEKIKGQFIKNI